MTRFRRSTVQHTYHSQGKPLNATCMQATKGGPCHATATTDTDHKGHIQLRCKARMQSRQITFTFTPCVQLTFLRALSSTKVGLQMLSQQVCVGSVSLLQDVLHLLLPLTAPTPRRSSSHTMDSSTEACTCRADIITSKATDFVRHARSSMLANVLVYVCDTHNVCECVSDRPQVYMPTVKVKAVWSMPPKRRSWAEMFT